VYPIVSMCLRWCGVKNSGAVTASFVLATFMHVLFAAAVPVLVFVLLDEGCMGLYVHLWNECRSGKLYEHLRSALTSLCTQGRCVTVFDFGV
jgi:hypothetical protein